MRNVSMDINVLKADYHRNGIAGQGFHTVLFEADDEDVVRRYMATIFPARHQDGTCEVCDYFGQCPDVSNGMVAILDTDSMISWASDPIDALYISHWRGDTFEQALRIWLWDAENKRELDQGFDNIKHFEEWKHSKQTQALNKGFAESLYSDDVPYAPV